MTSKPRNEGKLPPILDMIFDMKMYSSIPNDDYRFSAIISYQGSKDAYCPSCGGQTTYIVNPYFIQRWYDEKYTSRRNYVGQTFNSPEDTDVVLFIASCSRNQDHKVFGLFRHEQQVWTKVAQHPSEHEMNHELSEIRKVAGNESYNDLKKSSILHSQGLGAGSFVYLRRAFERLIERYENDRNLPHLGRMNDRLEALRNVVPDVLYKNKKVWGFLSQGVHELDDDECRAAFDIVFPCIMLMLSQEKSRKDTQKQEKAISAGIGNLTSSKP